MLARTDLALNAALGISTFMGIGSGIRSVRAAWAMRGIGTAERLSYIRGIAGASGVTVEVGEAFFRPLGQWVVVVAEISSTLSRSTLLPLDWPILSTSLGFQ